MIHWTNRAAIFLLTGLLSAGGLQLPAQQKSPGASPSAGASAGPGNTGTPSPTNGTRNNPTNPTLNPNSRDNPNNQSWDRAIFLSGKVMFDDGSPVNMDVRIERVCGSNARTEGHVDNKGRFSFQLGANSMSEISAADSSYSDFGNGTRNQNPQFGGIGNSSLSWRNGGSETALWGCELRAAYPGYRSDSISLSGHRSLDDPNVGTIILHRLGNVQGTTISLTTAQAPKSAQKEFEKGLQAARKGKLEDAEKHLETATTDYPKYAVAWFTLGQIEMRQNKNEEARKDFLAALEADKKYVSPYDQLALLAARDGKWEDAANYSQQAISLNPVEFPSSFWYNTISNYNLNKVDLASKSAQALVKLDTQHRYPEVNRMLAEIALNNKEYDGAAGYLRTYLQQAPAAKDAEALKQQLLKIEEASAQIKK